MHFTYCPDCGTKTVLRQMGDDGAVPYCAQCEKPLFDMFSTCVLSVILNDTGSIALIRQSYGQQETFVGVAGYMKPGESGEEHHHRGLQLGDRLLRGGVGLVGIVLADDLQRLLQRAALLADRVDCIIVV